MCESLPKPPEIDNKKGDSTRSHKKQTRHLWDTTPFGSPEIHVVSESCKITSVWILWEIFITQKNHGQSTYPPQDLGFNTALSRETNG